MNFDPQTGLLPIGPHDHPEARTMVWTDMELRAIKVYAAKCVAAERERIAASLHSQARLTLDCVEHLNGRAKQAT